MCTGMRHGIDMSAIGSIQKREAGRGDAGNAEGADGDRLEEALAAELAEKDEQIIR